MEREMEMEMEMEMVCACVRERQRDKHTHTLSLSLSRPLLRVPNVMCFLHRLFCHRVVVGITLYRTGPGAGGVEVVVDEVLPVLA